MKNVYLGINFGHDAGITVLKNYEIYSVLSERVNTCKQSAEINHNILNRVLNEAATNLKELDNVAITSTQGRGIPHRKDSLFAPFTSSQYFDEYFEGPKNQYMLVTQFVKNPEKIPAVCHIDKSARCQIILESDTLLNSILQKLNNANIPPVLINTSFNSKEEPIINDSLRALNFFINTNQIGFLLLENNLLVKRN